MARIRKLIGEKCFLSPICLTDAEIYTHWLNLEITIMIDIIFMDILTSNFYKE